MMKSKLLNTLILAAVAVPSVAMAEDSPYSGNVAITSNYLYRGVSQTGDKVALQGGFDYAAPSGVYVGVWGSSISWLTDAGMYNSSSVELDTYAGYGGSVNDDVSYDVGFLRYNYPGEYNYSAGQISADTNEVYGSVSYKFLKLKYSKSMTNLFGIPKSDGSAYIDLSASFEVGSGVSVGAHYGKQSIAGTGNDVWNYTDYNVSASKDFSGFTVGLMVSKLKGGTTGSYTDKQEKSKVVATLSHSM